MNTKRNIFSFFLLSTYILVLLHSLVPHFHNAEEHETHEVITHSEHHHHTDDHAHQHDDHSHDNSTEHHHLAELGFLHSLGHLFGDINHTSEDDHQLYVNSEKRTLDFNPEAIVAVVISILVVPTPIDDSHIIPEPPAPPNERLCYTVVPLRGPPSLS